MKAYFIGGGIGSLAGAAFLVRDAQLPGRDIVVYEAQPLFGGVAKPMSDCGGAEILKELCGHLNFEPSVFEDAICIPCRMPYITSMFMPRNLADRPLPVPRNSVNLAFVSQFVEIPDDVVFTVEYSVRAAQMAVYQLMKIDRPVPPVTRHDKSLAVIFATLEKAFA
ncbi:oleate hydratase [Bradyrhizobium sp. CNPSo 4010]|uniref:Oleate hydratase n=2 Tax=Bradyrhizobium agreste TaxID=2751811 RepID=A0ABS0PNU4_9BRAD|nr:oleate hydratase [Bradyrhizobium agreste]